jgi:hypothetical protein
VDLGEKNLVHNRLIVLSGAEQLGYCLPCWLLAGKDATYQLQSLYVPLVVLVHLVDHLFYDCSNRLVFQLSKLFACDAFNLYHKQLEESVCFPRAFRCFQIFQHQEVADSTMKREKAGLTNVGVNPLIPFHMVIQEQLG